VLVLVAALAWLWIGPWVRERVGIVGPGPGPRADALRIVSWNLANFEGEASGHDLDRIREVLGELDPDVLALQEIRDLAALAELLPEFELIGSDQGGRGGQRLVIAWRPERVELLASAEHPQLSLDGRVRPGLSGYLRGRDGGPDFWLLVVHLKAMPAGFEQREQQWRSLLAIAEATSLGPTGGQGDRDLVIVGDFNSTGPVGSNPADEHRRLDQALAPAGLRRLVSATGCTAYYDGRRRDAWQQPSEIDLVWVRELHESLAVDAVVHSGTHCAASACREFRSTEAYPVRDYRHVSDHCPVVVDLARADDD
jgi:endonuclease/exonuclease/phosphatase family metal-dependent hydrolase